MNVSLVITCWNGKKLLEKNLPFVIQASRNPDNKIKEIIVVDDASADDSVRFLKSSFPEVKVVTHDRNYGYAVTCNTGIKEAKNDLVVIFNLDVVPEVDFLKFALPHFKDKNVFAVSFNEGNFGPGKLVWKNGFLEIQKTNVFKKTVLTDWPSGGSSVFRKKIWEQLNGMDRIFLPFYFEDIDLGLRARKAGFKCLWEPKAKVRHEHEATINEKSFDKSFIDFIKQRNHLFLTWKNLYSPKLILSHFLNLLKRCFFHPKYLKIIFFALKRWICL